MEQIPVKKNVENYLKTTEKSKWRHHQEVSQETHAVERVLNRAFTPLSQPPDCSDVF